MPMKKLYLLKIILEKGDWTGAMRITIEAYDAKLTYETSNDDPTGGEWLEIFTKMLVVLPGFAPDIIKLADGGRYKCDYEEGQ